MLRLIRIGGLYLAQALKSRLEYRADFVIECLAALLQQSAGLLLVFFLFNEFEAVGEWTRADVLFIYGFSLIPMACFDAFAQSFYMFSDKYIVSGEFDRLLLRPLPAIFQLFMEGISFDFLADLTLGIAVLAYAWRDVGPEINAAVLLQLAVCVIGGWGVLTGVFLMLTSLSFWSQDRVSLVPPIYNLLNFARYPLNIYPPLVRLLLTWVVPFGFVAFYPAAAFIEKGAAFRNLSALTPLMGLASLCVGLLVWRSGVRRYAGAGS